MTEQRTRPPRTAAQVTLTALFLVAAVIGYLTGLVVGAFGFRPGEPCTTCPPNAYGDGALILLGVLAVTLIATMSLVARGRAPWVIPLAGSVIIIAGWVVAISLAGFTAFGV